jgi:flagellar protein FliS
MNAATQARQEYLRSRVMSATSEQLHLMLIEGAIRFATQGKEALEAKNYEGLFNALDRAQRIVVELTTGLNREVNPQLVEQFLALYNFIYGRLVQASLHRDAKALDEALEILRSQRETWQIIVDKIQKDVPQGLANRPAPAQPAALPAAPAAGGTAASGESASAFVAQG